MVRVELNQTLFDPHVWRAARGRRRDVSAQGMAAARFSFVGQGHNLTLAC
jgi:hypothetical protein